MKKATFILLATGGFLAAAASSAFAQAFVGLGTGGNNLSFYTAPGTAPTTYSVTGLTAGDSIVNIDYFTSGSGQLFGIGSSGSLYTLAQSGVTTYAATVNAANAVPGATVADFNPMANRLRVYAGTSNFRVTPGTGLLTSDGTLSYNVSTDPAFGQTPALTAAAYTNNFAGTTSTALYSLDSLQDTLVLNTGAPQFSGLSTVATLTLGGVRFDIAPGTTGFDIQTINGVNTTYLSSGNRLFTLNLTSGVLTAVGGGTGTQLGTNIIDIAFAVPEPGTYAMFGAGALVLGAAMLRRRQQAAA